MDKRLPRAAGGAAQAGWVGWRLGRSQQPVQGLLGLALHLGVQAVAVRVHGDHHGEVLDLNDPQGFGHAEVQLIHAEDPPNGLQHLQVRRR